MENPCEELNQMLKNVPTYASWSTGQLEDMFLRYRAIVNEIIDSKAYAGFRWLSDYCPDLGKRLYEMRRETNSEKQSRAFDNIAFELKSAMEVLTGKLNCSGQEQWTQLMNKGVNKSPQQGK